MGFGVSDGAAGGISLRGLSGGNARMMVLIDGYPQYAGIFGHPISDSYQSLLADKVEVLRGPASVLYGSNAMGGVVNIVTRKMHADGVRTHLRAGYGSYNTLETELTNSIRHKRFSSVVSGSYNRTDGHRDDMNFEQYGGYAKVAYDFSDNWNVYADVNVTHFNASYPGPAGEPLVDGDQRITCGVTSLAVNNDYGRTSGALSFFYNWGNHWINDGYTPSQGETSQDGRFSSRDNMMGVSLYQSASFFAGNRITAGFDWFRYGGKAWTDYVAGPNAGTRRDLVDKYENELAGYVDFRQNIGHWLTLNAGVRMDHHSRVDTEWIPQGGVALHLPHDMELKASATKGFRYPILREMYMFPPQNPDLRPESLWNYGYLHMKNPVIAAPEHKLYAGVVFTRQKWIVSTGVQYVAGLYTSVNPDRQEHFVLWNLRGQFNVNRWVGLWARGENLLAQRYDINAGYPMPKATVMAGINLNF